MYVVLVLCLLARSPGMAIVSTTVVSALNARFRAGTVSDHPAAAGVVLHGLNLQLGAPGPTPWLSSERAARVSCVIANARLPFLYHGWPRSTKNQRSPGFVLRPSVVKRALLCAYGRDSTTNKMNCPAGTGAHLLASARQVPPLWSKPSVAVDAGRLGQCPLHIFPRGARLRRRPLYISPRNVSLPRCV